MYIKRPREGFNLQDLAIERGTPVELCKTPHECGAETTGEIGIEAPAECVAMRRDAPRGTPQHLARGTGYVLDFGRKYFSINSSSNNGNYVNLRQKNAESVAQIQSIQQATITSHCTLHL